MRWPVLVFAALSLASCATRAERITAALEKHGVHGRQAKCMGERLADRLDTAQLERLNQLSKLTRSEDGRKLRLDDLLDQLNHDGDPQLVSAVVKAGLHCAI